ncbi:MAG TPA: putative N-acetylmannosamine-6-phosphate 2-epimerase [Firmicutes bacterium]|nr:putative N-acetylmannosamine-6-phosphate 2-epimerase [Candidatus Fermentithermobacillaceae bacterium]
MHPVIEKLRGGLLVSCMATEEEILHGPMLMAALAACAEQGGAVGIKASGERDVAAVSRTVKIPVMGMTSRNDPSGKRWITPTFEACEALVKAGAQIVAIQGTKARTYGDPTEVLIKRTHEELNAALMVDVTNVEEAQAAEAMGADLVRPTYRQPTPDWDLLGKVISAVSCPVVAEGGYWRPEEVARAFDMGAYCAVVGTAITRPALLTRWWIDTIAKARG